MDKRLKIFTESSLRHLEAIDGLPINVEDTSEEQATRNREKRKALVDGIQTLLNKNDKHVRRLEEYRKRLDGEIL
uniref:BAG domain-containing protein n=1 Tax=Heterorhabditis bacteriophora TaxID=37862 RepID=A0A1I7WTZ9_HETBA